MPNELTYDCDGVTYAGYLADGSAEKRAPGIVVLHEAAGLGPHARAKADLLAASGYVAFAPDFFGGPVENMQQASTHIGELSGDISKLRRRCRAALDALCALPSVDSGKLAAIGFCFGGQAALELARSGADLLATVGFHSGLKMSDPSDAAKIKGKVLVCLGDRDPLVPRDARDTFMDNLTDNGVDAQMLLLSGVGHSFTNPDAEAFGVPGCHYNEQADQRSWQAMQLLFAEAFTD
ncbi:hypothetical protein LK12_16885 [Novosphingobium malaysiense]|uniref:Dienelactone hydrolase domain-containing protein n=1 Tax=Novosphingobium malaysiense TaxID=1348853 RepID=A0A0B1ZLY0_9SPHN|nr:hypothetical protein LK12_16885 [Novosphingobium malaysiense]